MAVGPDFCELTGGFDPQQRPLFLVETVDRAHHGSTGRNAKAQAQLRYGFSTVPRDPSSIKSVALDNETIARKTQPASIVGCARVAVVDNHDALALRQLLVGVAHVRAI